MSEAKAILLYFATLVVVIVLLIGAFVLSAYLVDIFIGLLAIVLLTLVAIGWRKWQHSRLSVNEDRREHRRLLLEEAERRERLRIERERHEHELDLELRTFQLQQHLALTRAGYDANGNPPIFLHEDGRYTLLPPANPPYRPLQAQLKAPDDQKQAVNQVEQALPPPIDAYDLLASGQWTPLPGMLLLAVGAGGALIQVAITLAWHIALAGATGGGKCLAGDAPVFLADGRILPAKDLIGQTVEVIGVSDVASMHQIPTPATFANNGVRVVLEIALDNGVLLTRTEEHPFWAACLDENQWGGRQADGQAKYRTSAVHAGWVAAKDIKACGNRPCTNGHVVLCPLSLRQKGIRKRPKEEVLLCAAFLAEGALTRPSTTRFTSASPEKKIPGWIFQLPDEQIALFLRVFFDCGGWINDGHATDSPSVTIELASPILVEQLAQLALRLGITGTFRQKDTAHARVWIWSTRMVDVWQERIGSEVKAAALSRAVRCMTQNQAQAKTSWSAWRGARPTDGQTFADCPAGYEWRKVVSVRRSLAPTVSIQVHNGNHAFVGYAVEHNTNMLRLLLAQLVRQYEVYYVSPAFAPIKANHEDWRQLEARLAGPVACDAVGIKARLQWAVEMYQYRQEQERAGDFTWQQKPIYLVIDEYIAVCKRYPGAAEDVSELLRFARQYQVFVIVASQDFLIKNIGGDSGARDCYRTALYFGGDPTTARALLDISGTLPYEQDLGKEGLLVLRTRSTQVSQARAPFMSNRAIYELLGWPADPILDDRPVTHAHAGPIGAQWGTAGYPPMEPLQPKARGPQAMDPTVRCAPSTDPSTGNLETVVDALAEPEAMGPAQAPTSADEPAKASVEKQFTLEQEMRFVRLYRVNPNIRECLRAMRLGNRYYAHASRLVEARKLRKV